jgi:hypothetical protein
MSFSKTKIISTPSGSKPLTPAMRRKGLKVLDDTAVVFVWSFLMPIALAPHQTKKWGKIILRRRS